MTFLKGAAAGGGLPAWPTLGSLALSPPTFPLPVLCCAGDSDFLLPGSGFRTLAGVEPPEGDADAAAAAAAGWMALIESSLLRCCSPLSSQVRTSGLSLPSMPGVIPMRAIFLGPGEAEPSPSSCLRFVPATGVGALGAGSFAGWGEAESSTDRLRLLSEGVGAREGDAEVAG